MFTSATFSNTNHVQSQQNGENNTTDNIGVIRPDQRSAEKQNPENFVDKVEEQMLNMEQNEKDNETTKLKQEIEVLQTELKNTKLLAQANEINLQKRYEQEVDKAKQFGTQKLVGLLLQTVDYLEMALSDNSADVDTLRQGVTMTLNDFVKTLENQGVSAIEVNVGDKFNPNEHQAIGVVPIPENTEIEKDTIAQVIKKGYKLHNRVVRSSVVMVYQ